MLSITPSAWIKNLQADQDSNLDPVRDREVTQFTASVLYPKWDSNPHGPFGPLGLKPSASTNSAIRAFRIVCGKGRDRTAIHGFSVRRIDQLCYLPELNQNVNEQD